MLSKNLRERMTMNNMTIAQTADAAQISESTLKKILSGVTAAPSRQTLSDLASVLGCTVEELLADPEESNRKARSFNADMAMMLAYERTLAEKDRRIEDLKSTMRHKSMWVTILVCILAIVIAFLVGWLVYDLSHLDRGWFQN